MSITLMLIDARPTPALKEAKYKCEEGEGRENRQLRKTERGNDVRVCMAQVKSLDGVSIWSGGIFLSAKVVEVV